MAEPTRLIVLVPAFNEGATVGSVVNNVREALPRAAVLVIDDGSTDDTALAALSAGALVARLPYNLGVGGAMRLGYRYAAAEDYDYAVQIDADGQHDPRYVKVLLDALDRADIVIGARFAGVGDYTVKGPRRWAMKLLARTASRVAATPLTDITSGFRACNRDGIRFFAKFYPVEYLGDTVETTIVAARAGYRITQEPVVMRERMAGSPSQSPLKASIYLGRAIMALIIATTRRRAALPPGPGMR